MLENVLAVCSNFVVLMLYEITEINSRILQNSLQMHPFIVNLEL